MDANEEMKDMDQEILGQMLTHFLPEARENLDHLNLCLIQMEKDPADEEIVETVFRVFHTLKGGAGFAGLDHVSALAKAFESLIGDVRKGKIKIRSSGFNVIYDGLDLFFFMIDKAEANEQAETDISGLLTKIDRIRSNQDPEDDCDCAEFLDDASQEQEELLTIYRDGYNQLGALKHLIYESVHLSDPESLAVLLSNQIHERMAPERNGFWLVERPNTLVEIARNGKLVDLDKRRKLEINSSEALRRAICEQVTIWPSESETLNALLTEYASPVIFPIKSNQAALGMLILDPEEQTEVELYQFISQFAAMIMRISTLHQKVDEQREELDEMTEILFRQNAQLSSLYHVEMNLVKESDPVKLCEIVTEAVVTDLEAKRAAAFLYDQRTNEFVAASEFGGLNGIVGNRYGIDDINVLAKCLKTGRIVTQTDYGEPVEIGSNRLEGWIALCLKGREHSRGVMIAEVDDEDIGDPISILTNYLGILLDNIMLQQKVKEE
jgi:chemotaxis protein histidine kinase CheA